ncbi:MAG: antitoxin MazE family protein [Tagaea sp.]|nr:antitoxin MazE family protein [Tagaea sp.]
MKRTAKPKPKAQSGAARVAKRRAALRRAGLRPVQIWVPDTRNPAYIADVKRRCLALRGDPQEKEILDWIEAVADYSGWK